MYTNIIPTCGPSPCSFVGQALLQLVAHPAPAIYVSITVASSHDQDKPYLLYDKPSVAKDFHGPPLRVGLSSLVRKGRMVSETPFCQASWLGHIETPLIMMRIIVYLLLLLIITTNSN